MWFKQNQYSECLAITTTIYLSWL